MDNNYKEEIPSIDWTIGRLKVDEMIIFEDLFNDDDNDNDRDNDRFNDGKGNK